VGTQLLLSTKLGTGAYDFLSTGVPEGEQGRGKGGGGGGRMQIAPGIGYRDNMEGEDLWQSNT